MSADWGPLQKSAVTAQYQDVIAELATHVDTVEHWPNIADRFKALGPEFEISYRTSYSALCNEVHHTAEDILHSMVVTATGHRFLMDAHETEIKLFNWFTVTLALEKYAKAVGTYLRVFNIVTSSKESARVSRSATELTHMAHASCEMLNHMTQEAAMREARRLQNFKGKGKQVRRKN